MQRLVIACIRFYRLCISPFMAPHCRFYPTCSQYAIEAVQEHGVLRGSLLGAKRLLRCHPLNEGGFDPVPPCSCHSKNNPLHQASKQ